MMGVDWTVGETYDAVQEAIEERKALLRVARAAEIAWPYLFGDMPKKQNHKRITYEKLYDALKEVEHLLERMDDD
jgi:hypothetical protein